jgi:hypothetical protein
MMPFLLLLTFLALLIALTRFAMAFLAKPKNLFLRCIVSGTFGLLMSLCFLAITVSIDHTQAKNLPIILLLIALGLALAIAAWIDVGRQTLKLSAATQAEPAETPNETNSSIASNAFIKTTEPPRYAADRYCDFYEALEPWIGDEIIFDYEHADGSIRQEWVTLDAVEVRGRFFGDDDGERKVFYKRHVIGGIENFSTGDFWCPDDIDTEEHAQ